jgi:hypothetical protein
MEKNIGSDRTEWDQESNLAMESNNKDNYSGEYSLTSYCGNNFMDGNQVMER